MANAQQVSPVVNTTVPPAPYLTNSGGNIVIVNGTQETVVGQNADFPPIPPFGAKAPTQFIGTKGTWISGGKVFYYDGTNKKEVGDGSVPQIFKDGILYFKNDVEGIAQLFYYDGQKSTLVSDAALTNSKLLPTVFLDKGLALWKQQNGQVALFDGQTVKNLDGTNYYSFTFSRTGGVFPPTIVDVSADRVVFTSVKDPYYPLDLTLSILYTDSAKKSVTTAITSNQPLESQVTASPKYVYGNVDPSILGTLARYDGSTTTNISKVVPYGNLLTLGDNLYFTQADSSNIQQVYKYDGASIVAISQNKSATDKIIPRLSNGKVIFTANDGNDTEVYSYDGQKLTQITDNTVSDNAVSPIASKDGSLYYWTEDILVNGAIQSQGVLYNVVSNQFTKFLAADVGINNPIFTNVLSEPASFDDQNNLVLYQGVRLSLGNSNVNPLNILGTAGSDTLFGSAGNDTLVGADGNDLIFGRGGGDSLYGGNDNDTIDGEDGVDQLFGGNGIDSLYGGNDNDVLNGESGNDYLNGGSGNDYLNGGDGNDFLFGDTGNDYLYGNDGNNTLYGGAGADFIYGGIGSNLLSGDDGDDNIFNVVVSLGVIGSSTLVGGNGNDVLVSDSGNNLLLGGDGNDQLYANGYIGTSETLFGGAGDDNLSDDYASSILDGGDGNDNLTGRLGNDSLYGANGIDFLDGGSGLDYLNGGNDNDFLKGGSEADTLDGAAGNDILDGEDDHDLLFGGDGNDSLYGANGDDTIYGSNGDDYLNGDNGFDILIGGAGKDIFAGFSANLGNKDTITDFQVGTDKIALSKTSFSALQSLVGNGFSVATDFAVVADTLSIASSKALIVYNSKDGSVTYNQNRELAGLGTGNEFAKLTSLPVGLSANDFQIVG
jgi:Ca2+-binding RTX toxin-like protein